MGISLLVNPTCPPHIHHLPPSDPQLSNYTLSSVIANTLVHCLYLPPSLDPDETLAILAQLQLSHPGTTNTILCGDFNARLEQRLGDHHTNSRGRALDQWIIDNDLQHWNEQLAYGEPTFIKPTGTSIIDWFLSTSTFQTTPFLFIDADLSLGSDHKLMHFSFDPTSESPPLQPQSQRILLRLRRLNQHHLYERYREHFSQLTSSLQSTLHHHQQNTTPPDDLRTKIEEWNNDLCLHIYDALDSSIGRVQAQGEQQHIFWTEEMTETTNQREHHYSKWRRAIGQTKMTHWIQHQRSKAKSLAAFTSLGLNPAGFPKLLSSRLYQQFLRPQLEYGLAILDIGKTLAKQLDKAQDTALRRIYGAHSRSSTKVMKHLVPIPSMYHRTQTLRFKYLQRTSWIPDDCLLRLIIDITTASHPSPTTNTSPWIKLYKLPIWTEYQQMDYQPPLKVYFNQILDNHLATDQQSSVHLRNCRPKRGIDPILLLPMLNVHRSRLIRWRLGWLAGGANLTCTCGQPLTKSHITSCFRLHDRLALDPSITDPLSHTLNKLPRNPHSYGLINRWRITWSILKKVMLVLEILHHPNHIDKTLPPDDPFLVWLDQKYDNISPPLIPWVPYYCPTLD